MTDSKPATPDDVRENALNGDLSVPASADTEAMDWAPSPSGTVWRKRVHCVGPAEAGQVTSVVRYQPGSSFHTHDHPDGEEILVLDGVFSDEHGDWPKGTYLLNPEGFRHAPFSREGCLLFVKLRQFPGLTRRHVAITTDQLVWQPGPAAGIETKPLYAQAGYTDTMHLERWAAGPERRALGSGGGLELFVLGGELKVCGPRRDEETIRWLGADGRRFGAGAWLRIPAGMALEAESTSGCVCYVKRGGFQYLSG
jgi:hypothetical protein